MPDSQAVPQAADAGVGFVADPGGVVFRDRDVHGVAQGGDQLRVLPGRQGGAHPQGMA